MTLYEKFISIFGEYQPIVTSGSAVGVDATQCVDYGYIMMCICFAIVLWSVCRCIGIILGGVRK